MAYEQPNFKLSLDAASDLSAKQFTALKISGDNEADSAGAGEKSIGILQNDPKAGESCTVCCEGVSKAEYGAAVTAGDNLMANASGQLVPATTGNHVVAQALTAGSTGELGSVYMQLATAPLA